MATSNLLYTANTGIAFINVPNPNLNGGGTIVGALTGALNGTYIKSITVKSVGNTSEGMVRLYIKPTGGGADMLFREVYVPASVQTSVVPAFAAMVEGGFTLNPGDQITASTQNGDGFNIIVDGSDFESCGCGGE